MTDMEYHSRLTKLIKDNERLQEEHHRLCVMFEDLKERLEEVRRMESLERDRRTHVTQTIDYSYQLK